MRIPKVIQDWLSKLTTILVLVLLLFGLYLLANQPVNSGLYVHFLDVGQGDSELIQTKSGQNILIDGGPDSAVISRLDSFIPFYEREIDSIILTHPHADHLAGLNDVLRKYKVSHIYFSGVAYTTNEYIDFLSLAKEKRVAVSSVKVGDYLNIGDNAKIDFIYPGTSLSAQKIENLNNSSVVTRLVYGSESVLFMGDLENEGQDELMKYAKIEKSTIYKAPHHGSKDSVNATFYALVAPQYVVIEVGKDNKFGHPSAPALSLFNGANVFRTDEDGTVSFEIGKDSVRRVR